MTSVVSSRILAIVAAICVATSPAAAQATTTTDPIASYLRRAFNAVANDIVAAAAVMPEADYGFRPAGVVSEVRDFAALLDHLLMVNSLNCSMGKGVPDLRASMGRAPITEKAKLLKALEEVHALCSDYLASLTDATLSEAVSTNSGSVQLTAIRANGMIFTIAHSNEHYGNIVTYLRARGLVPPPTAAQAAPFTVVRPK